MYYLKKIFNFLFSSSIKEEILVLCLSLICLVLSFFKIYIIGIDPSWVVIIFCGVPIVYSAIKGLIKNFDIKADVLVAMALVSSIYIKEYFAAAEICFIMQLGSFLKGLTVSKARKGIQKLLSLAPRYAHLVTEEESTKTILCDEVRVSDILRVYPGEIIPVDGILTKGQTIVDESILTGEYLPVEKTINDKLLAGSFNKYSTIDIISEKTCSNSTVQRMAQVLKSSSPDKARIVSFADQCATWIVLLAVSISIICWFITEDIIRSVTVLVVFCPCAFVLATPTAIIAAIGNLTKKGFLVQKGESLETLAKIKTISFDKTGTLSYGNCKVTNIILQDTKLSDLNLNPDLIYKYVASIELSSHHPLSSAIVQSYKEKYPDSILEHSHDFKSYFGKGVQGTISNHSFVIGNKKLLNDFNIPINLDLKDKEECKELEGSTLIHIGVDGVHIGFLTICDSIREESFSLIKYFTQNNISPVLITGDNQKVALNVASKLGIKEVHAETLPEEKLEIIKNLCHSNPPVCMVGDGINDALALKQADVSIAVSSVGNEILVDISDIVVVGNNFKYLDFLFKLSKKMLSTIKLNMVFSFGINTLAISCAVMGILGPVGGALVHNAGSFAVVLNSSLLLKKRFNK